MGILPRLLLFELWQRLLYLSISLVCVYILSLKAFLYLQVNYISPSSCNVLKYYWWLSVYSVAPPSSSRSLLASVSTVRCLRVFQTRVPWSTSSRLASGRFATLPSYDIQLPNNSTGWRTSSSRHESSAPAPAPALIPNPTNKPLSRNLPTRRQAGFHSLSAASPTSCASSLSNTSARSKPLIYWAAALDLFPSGQDGRRPRRPATAADPRTDIATELDLDHGLSLHSTAPGHLVHCGCGSRRRGRNFDVEPTTDEVGGYPECEHLWP